MGVTQVAWTGSNFCPTASRNHLSHFRMHVLHDAKRLQTLLDGAAPLVLHFAIERRWPRQAEASLGPAVYLQSTELECSRA